MITRFSKVNLAKIQEKKAKVGLTGGLLTRKHQRDSKLPKDDPMVTSPIAKAIPQRTSSPTSSLEPITPFDDASKPKGKDKASKDSFWDDVGSAMLKAHEVILVDNLSPLGYLDYKEKYVVAKTKVESLSVQNESLRSQISALAEESKKDKESLKALEKSIDTEKAFSKLKDMQIDKAF
nr:hypothetical protein CFP56_50239 [Quercus suber]